MATAVAPADVLFLKNTQILVNVDEALTDMLVVSYFNQNSNKRFQGVLLDSTKRNLPFGVSSLNPVFLPSEKCTNGNEDKLFSTSQRFAYQDPDYSSKPPVKSKQNQQKNKMTVRLRPRKVLCSNCKGICNENSENVADTGKRKTGTSTNNATVKEKKVYLNAETRSRKYDEEDNRTNNLMMGSSLIPKISRLHPNEISNAMNGSSNSACDYRNEIWIHDSDSEKYHEDGVGCDSEGNVGKRKGRSGGQPKQENEHMNNGNKKKNKHDFILPDVEDNVSGVFSSARTLKISYGEGEGTVLKIPAIISGYSEEEDRVVEENGKEEMRAARKAHKKSKKQARRQASRSPNSHSNDSDYQAYPRKHKKVKVNKKRKDTYKEDDSIIASALDSHPRDPLATDPLATTNTNITPLSPTPIDVIS